MKPIYYICACGCKVPQKKIKKFQKMVDSQRFCQLRCPKHFDSILGRAEEYIFKCQRPECGKMFSAGIGAKYCDECKPIAEKEKRAIANQEYYNNNPDKFHKVKNSPPPDGFETDINCHWFGNVCGSVCISGNVHCSMRRGYDLPVDRDDEVAA